MAYIALWCASAAVAGCGAKSGGADSSNDVSSRDLRTQTPYCETFYKRAAGALQASEAATQQSKTNPILGLASGLTSVGQIDGLFRGLALHAPNDIRADTEAARDAFSELQSKIAASAGNPAAGLASTLATAAFAQPSFDAVGQYLQTACPLDSEIARRYLQNSTTPGGATEPPAGYLVKTTLAGKVSVISNGTTFTILQDAVEVGTGKELSTATAYDFAGKALATVPAGSFTGACGVADIDVAGIGRLLIASSTSITPARGVEPEQTATQLVAWKASDGSKLWAIDLPASYTACPEGDIPGALGGFAATRDGRWGVKDDGESGGLVIDLASGSARRSRLVNGVVGNAVAHDNRSTRNPSLTLLDPKSDLRIGSVAGVEFRPGAELAPWGNDLTTDTEGVSPSAGATQDGESLLGIQSESGQLAAYALPSGRVRWKSDQRYPYLFGEAGGVALTAAAGGDGDARLTAIDVPSGKVRWTAPYSEVCGLTASETLIVVNGQQAVLSTQTGKQIRYSATADTCPEIMNGGYIASTGGSEPGETREVSVLRGLAP